MAERRYSQSDQEKMKRDFMSNANAKGCDFKEMWPTADGGTVEAIKEMNKDFSFTKDQSQAWTEHNAEKIKNDKKSRDSG